MTFSEAVCRETGMSMDKAIRATIATLIARFIVSAVKGAGLAAGAMLVLKLL